MVKIILYFISVPIVAYALGALNINKFFKPNRVLQSRILYFVLGFSLMYLFTNFLYDLFETFGLNILKSIVLW